MKYTVTELNIDGLQSSGFSGEKLSLRQDWMLEPDADFEPAYVKLGYSGDKLLIFAELTDSDIHNPATRFNDPVRNQGDFFEIILRPDGQEHYYEMHITPDNIQSQYCFPGEKVLKEQIRGKGIEYIIENFGVTEKLFESQVKVDKDNNIWRVFAKVDLTAITADYKKTAEQKTHFAFCRYNYNKLLTEPQLSSTARLTEMNFHHQNQWDTLVIPAKK